MHKNAVVNMIETLATTLGYPLVGPNGRPAFGGHVFRVSGTWHLAAAGLEINVIMLLARWGSNVVMHYIPGPPLKNLTKAYLGAQHGSVAQEESLITRCVVSAFDPAELLAIKEVARDAEQEAASVRQLIADLSAQVQQMRAHADMVHLINDGGNGALHKVGSPFQGAHPSSWITKCGWRYGGADIKRVPTIPLGFHFERVCAKCAHWHGGDDELKMAARTTATTASMSCMGEPRRWAKWGASWWQRW